MRQNKLQQLLNPERRPSEERRALVFHGERIPLGPNEYTVSVNGKLGIVTILPTGAIPLYWVGEARETHSFRDLVAAARRNEIPSWVQQVPALMEKIDAVFARERAAGKDPYVRVGVSGDEVFRDDLRNGTRLSLTIREIRRRFALGGTLPALFDTPEVRTHLGLPAKEERQMKPGRGK